MRYLTMTLAGLFVLGSGLATDVWAQKGMGQTEGLARQGVRPEMVTFSGVVNEIKQGPCETTTGKSVVGTHLLLKTEKGAIREIHLGPKADVDPLIANIAVGNPLTVTGFRTEKLPESAWVAQTLTAGEEVIRMRNDDMRPVWAAGPGQGRGRGLGRGAGPGQGPGIVAGSGQGRGMGPGRGAGRGRGHGMGQGQGRGFRGGRGGPGGGQACRLNQGAACESQMKGLLDATPKGQLTEEQQQGLLLMREEEKLAHDVYVTLQQRWPLPPLANIPQAEARHQEFVKLLLDRYGLEDPVSQMKVGQFAAPAMQELYEKLIARGQQSVEEAIRVGALIEELDIADLQRLMDQTDNPDLLLVYENLERGSRNHLRAFARQLNRYGVTYQAEHLSQAEFDRIAASPHERGGLGRNAN